MNYFERCKKRIECAVEIDWSWSSGFNYVQRFKIGEALMIRKIGEVNSDISYSAEYKKINILISQEECETLFNFANERFIELETIKDNQILEEL